MLGLATEGLALTTAGDVEEGCAASTRPWPPPSAASTRNTSGCAGRVAALIYGCERVRDYDRAAQWCCKVDEFAERMRIQFVNGVCRAHYAAVLTWHGSWSR